ERARTAGYHARWTLSGGLGYKVIAEKDLTLNLKAGPAWRQIDLAYGITERELTGPAALGLGWKLSPTLSLSRVASTSVGDPTPTTSSLTALNAKLTGALSARVSYSAELDTNPPAGVENLDTLTRFTLVYGF